ncbi:SVOP protein, partial [Polypterus senegalus]
MEMRNIARPRRCTRSVERGDLSQQGSLDWRGQIPPFCYASPGVTKPASSRAHWRSPRAPHPSVFALYSSPEIKERTANGSTFSLLACFLSFFFRDLSAASRRIKRSRHRRCVAAFFSHGLGSILSVAVQHPAVLKWRCAGDETARRPRPPTDAIAMDEDLFQLRQLPVVKFRRTGESSRSEDDHVCGEHEIHIEGVRGDLEHVELGDESAVPKEFANPTDDTFMVEDAVEAIGFGQFQWKLSVLTGLAWMADAMEMMILSILAPQLHCEWKLPSWQVALLTSVFWALGTVFEVLLAILVMPRLGWTWLLLLSTVPLLLFAILCFWLPESARYDVLTGNQEKALATLKRIATENGAPMPLGKLIVARQEDRGKIRDLFTPHFRWTTLLLWFIWFSNAFSYYGLVLLTTELFQAGDICSGVLITLWIIDRIGRKKTMALSFVVFSSCTLLLFACVGRTALTIFLFIARAFISGGFQAAYVYTPEVYPTATRALGLGTCSGMARVGALITPFIAQVMLESSVYLTLSVYCCCCVLAAIASCALPIETTGRGLQESSHREWGQEMVGRASHSTEGFYRSSSGSQD